MSWENKHIINASCKTVAELQKFFTKYLYRRKYYVFQYYLLINMLLKTVVTDVHKYNIAFIETTSAISRKGTQRCWNNSLCAFYCQNGPQGKKEKLVTLQNINLIFHRRRYLQNIRGSRQFMYASFIKLLAYWITSVLSNLTQ